LLKAILFAYIRTGSPLGLGILFLVILISSLLFR
jgi:hypothetical protein